MTDYETMGAWEQTCKRPHIPPTSNQDTNTERVKDSITASFVVILSLLVAIFTTLAQITQTLSAAGAATSNTPWKSVFKAEQAWCLYRTGLRAQPVINEQSRVSQRRVLNS